jgi:hypothetical protein
MTERVNTPDLAVGADVVVHGVAHRVTAIAGDLLHCVTAPDAQGNVVHTRLRTAALARTDDAAIATPATVTTESTELVPMAEDDPRWARLRGDPGHWAEARQRRSAHVFAETLAARRRAGDSEDVARSTAARTAQEAADALCPTPELAHQLTAQYAAEG